MPKFNVERISKLDNSKSFVQVEAPDAAVAQRMAMSESHHVGSATRVGIRFSVSLLIIRIVSLILILNGVPLALVVFSAEPKFNNLPDFSLNVNRVLMTHHSGLALFVVGALSWVIAESAESVRRAIGSRL